VINKAFEGAVRRASYRLSTLLLGLIQNMIEITNAKPWASKTITNKSEGISKSWLVSFIRGAIEIGDNPRRRRLQVEILCLLVMKHSRSMPRHQESTRPPLEPIGGT
jgi:hypothetical protein